MHKAPSAFALASILKLAGKSRQVIGIFLVGVGLSVPLGMWLAYALLKSEKLPMTAGILLSMSAGTFIYIGACDLLPELHRTDKDKLLRLGAFGVGLLCSFLSGYLGA
jgi:zinc transporter ZupT